MAKRIVVSLKAEALPDLEAVADRLSRQVDMRVGVSFPRQGFIVGEVKGQVEMDRIQAMSEVAAIRQMGQAGPRPRH